MGGSGNLIDIKVSIKGEDVKNYKITGIYSGANYLDSSRMVIYLVKENERAVYEVLGKDFSAGQEVERMSSTVPNPDGID